MPFTLVAWSESVDSDASLTILDAVADDHITEVGDNIQVPSDLNKIALAKALMTGLDRAQIRAPSLQKDVNLELTSLLAGTEPGSPQEVDNWLPEGIELDVGEQMNAFVQAPANGAVVGTLLAWLFSTIDAAPTGTRFTMRFTASITCVAYTWVSGPITLSENLRAGRYAVVGAKVLGATLIAFRFIFTGKAERPGALGVDALSDIAEPIFRHGGMGSWGEFEHNELPRLECLAVTTDSAQTGYFDLVRVS